MTGGTHAAAKPSSSCDEAVRRRTASLDPLFNPSSVVIVGEADTPESRTGRVVATIAKGGFEGRLFGVGLGEAAAGTRTQDSPTVADLPPGVDLAVIAVASARLLQVIRECVEAGIKTAVVTPTCAGDEWHGAELQHCIRDLIRGTPLRLLGPNCSMLMNPALGLNVSADAPMAVGGTVALISQSNALCRGMLEWSFRGIVGFSAFASIGAMADIDWADLMDYFGADASTRSIVLFLESIGRNPRAFLSAAREVALNKPIIVLRAGRTQAARRIVEERTSVAPETDDVLDAALRRVGVLRVSTVAELFSMADVLSKQPRPAGPRLGIVSNAAGLSALAVDSAGDVGGELATMSAESRQLLSGMLPSPHSADNPIQLPVDAAPAEYAAAAQVLLRDPNCDGLLFLRSTEGSDEQTVTELLFAIENSAQKPVLACIMGAGHTGESKQLLTRARIPVFNNPQLAARAFGYMWRYAYNLGALYETPMRRADPVEQLRREISARIVSTARASSRAELTSDECRHLLANYGVHLLETRPARTEDDAVHEACALGYPVVLRVIGGEAAEAAQSFIVVDAETLRRTWQFVDSHAGNFQITATLHRYIRTNEFTFSISSRTDEQFGPVVVFGSGGPMAESATQRAYALPPLNATLAQRMVDRTPMGRALRASRTAAHDLPAVLKLIVRFSQLVVEQPGIKEVDIHPVLLSRDGCISVHARVSVHKCDVSEEQLPRPAIRPYPVQYMSRWETKRGDVVTIRPIQAEDERLMIKFYEALSDHSVYLRYFQHIKLSHRTQHDRLTRICFIDYDREMALVAERRDPETEERQIVGLGNLARVRGRNEAEVAVIVRDDFQGHGLGTELMRRLVQVARAEKMERVIGSTMLENTPTVAMMKRVGLRVSVNLEDQVVEGEINL